MGQTWRTDAITLYWQRISLDSAPGLEYALSHADRHPQ
jgi:hypothetical protein